MSGPAVGGYIYFGTSWFAADLLQGLVASGLAPSLVVTRPDRPAGRGRKLTPPDVAIAAQELGLELIQPEQIGEAEFAQIQALRPQSIVVCAYGAIIKDPLLSAYRSLNVHPSLLPRWRGAAPIERAIMAGDQQTGVSIMELVEELDAGPVYAQESIQIDPDANYEDVARQLLDLSLEMLVHTMVSLTADPDGITPSPQAEQGVTYAEKIMSGDREISEAETPTQAHNRVRALSPHIGARKKLGDGSWLGVKQARIAEDGSLELLRVQPPGGKPMPFEDYERGHSS